MSTWRERDALQNLEEITSDLYDTAQLLVDTKPDLARRAFELAKEAKMLRGDLAIEITSPRRDKPS